MAQELPNSLVEKVSSFLNTDKATVNSLPASVVDLIASKAQKFEALQSSLQSKNHCKLKLIKKKNNKNKYFGFIS